MNNDELAQILRWRLKRGYKGLNIRPDGRAWVVSYGRNRTTKNFPFNSKFDLKVLWQLEEACEFLELISSKSNPNIKMFGPQRLSKVRHVMKDGNDMEGVFIERHTSGLLRLQFQLHMPSEKYKFVIPKKLRTEEGISWCLAFARQVRALSFVKENKDLTKENIKAAWKEFKSTLQHELSYFEDQK